MAETMIKCPLRRSIRIWVDWGGSRWLLLYAAGTNFSYVTLAEQNARRDMPASSNRVGEAFSRPARA